MRATLQRQVRSSETTSRPPRQVGCAAPGVGCATTEAIIATACRLRERKHRVVSVDRSRFEPGYVAPMVGARLRQLIVLVLLSVTPVRAWPTLLLLPTDTDCSLWLLRSRPSNPHVLHWVFGDAH